MRNFIGGVLVMACIIYVFSPIDGFPGPIDDIVAIALTWAANNRLKGE